MTDPNIVGHMVAYGELELTPAALQRPLDAQQCHTDEVDAEQEDEQW